jgi:periplasmic protein TonB
MQSLIPKLCRVILLPVFLAFSATSLVADEKTEPPVPVRTVSPDVPSAFSRAGTIGLVTINFLVDDKGNVQEPRILKSSHSELEEPALIAIRKWRFKPAKRDGNAVAVHVTIPIKFEAAGSS